MKNGTRALIINADDFGMSQKNVNNIQDCYSNGVVSSISMFAAMPASEYGHSKLKAFCTQGVGVHLSFSCGTPFFPQAEIATLLNEKRQFYTSFELKSHLKNINPLELKREFKAQIQAVQSKTKVTHLDNHRTDIYFRPELFEVVFELAVEYNLPIRLPFDDAFDKAAAEYFAKLLGADSNFVFELGKSYVKKCSDLNIIRPNYFMQPQFKSLGLEKTLDLLKSLPLGVTEICAHPGDRPIEHQLWNHKEVKKLIIDQEIRLINFSELKDFTA